MRGGEFLETCKPYYFTELGTLYNGDCLEVMDYLINKGIKVDAIITDPPYSITSYKWDKIIPFEEMWKRLLKLIKDDGAIVLFGNEPFSSSLRNSNLEYYRYDWKWIKTQVTGFQSVKYQPLRCYEDIMVFSKGGIINHSKIHMKYFPQGTILINLKTKKPSIDYLHEKKNKQRTEYIQEYENFPRNVIQFPRESILYHPTQKPINLMKYIVSTYSEKGDLVLDFTSGSGSTLLACEILSRRWIGIELTEKYCKITKERIKKGIQLELQLNYQNNYILEEE